VDHAGLDAICDPFGLVGDGDHLTLDQSLLVGHANDPLRPDREREVGIVDLGGEVGRVQVGWLVRLRKRVGAGLRRRGLFG
jgi:hypothetical protein